MATASADVSRNLHPETQWEYDGHPFYCTIFEPGHTPPTRKNRHMTVTDCNEKLMTRKPIRQFDYDSDSADSDSSESTSSFDSDLPSSQDDFSLIDYDGNNGRFGERPRRDSYIDEDTPKAVEVPPFPIGDRIYFREECIVCLIESTHPLLHLNQSNTLKPRFRPCCMKFVCSPCLEEYCAVKVHEGIVHIGCPNPACHAYLHRDEIAFHLKTDSLKEKFYKFLIDANKDPLTKTCPRCCHVTRVKSSDSKCKKKKQGLQTTCPECDLVWCFTCQAPWHENISCRQYCAGDKLVVEWAKEVHYGSRNAQKCPKCLVYIERTEGCDHMSCGYCQTDFCYRCGGRYRSLRFLGSHHSRYSVFGCKYYLRPNKPAQRIIIRSSVLGGKVLAVSAVVTLGVALLPFALMAGAVMAPIYGGLALNRYLKKRARKPRRKCRGRRPAISATLAGASAGERLPVELLGVTPYLHTRTAIPPCELTSHFESDLDSTQMNEIRAELGDLHLESLMMALEPENEASFQPAPAELEKSGEMNQHRRRRRRLGSSGRDRIRGSSSRNRKRRAKIPSTFDTPDPEEENTDVFGLRTLFAEVERTQVNNGDDERPTSDLPSIRTSLTHVEIHGAIDDVTQINGDVEIYR